MDFYVDIGFAVLMRLLKDRRELKRWKQAFFKLWQMIDVAYEGAFSATVQQTSQHDPS